MHAPEATSEALVRQTRQGREVVLEARDPLRAAGYGLLSLGLGFLGLVVSGYGSFWAAPLGALLAVAPGWVALCSAFNRVSLEVGGGAEAPGAPVSVEVRYGPVPWPFRRRQFIRRVHRAWMDLSVVVPKGRLGKRDADELPVVTPWVVLRSVDGDEVRVRLGAPGARAHPWSYDPVVAVIEQGLGLSGPALPAPGAPPGAEAPQGPPSLGRCPHDGAVLAEGSGPLEQHACPTCRGSFVPAHAMQQVLDRLGLEVDEVRELASQFVGRSVGCPGCGQKMEITRLRGVVIDICFGCGGVWLDAGEDKPFLRLVAGDL